MVFHGGTPTFRLRCTSSEVDCFPIKRPAILASLSKAESRWEFRSGQKTFFDFYFSRAQLIACNQSSEENLFLCRRRSRSPLPSASCHRSRPSRRILGLILQRSPLPDSRLHKKLKRLRGYSALHSEG